jgi:hypothetical protein
MLDPVTDDPNRGELMSFEYLIDPATGPQWTGLLPGKPQPYVLRKGEHAMLCTDALQVFNWSGTAE